MRFIRTPLYLLSSQIVHRDIIRVTKYDFNSPGPQQKTYLSFGTDLAHVIDLTESFITGNENVDQNVQLE